MRPPCGVFAEDETVGSAVAHGALGQLCGVFAVAASSPWVVVEEGQPWRMLLQMDKIGEEGSKWRIWGGVEAVTVVAEATGAEVEADVEVEEPVASLVAMLLKDQPIVSNRASCLST